MTTRRARVYKGNKGRSALVSAPVTVPADYVGMHIHRYPIGSPLSPAPTYAYGSFRTHDGGLPWWRIEPAQGVFNWVECDAILNYHKAQGHTVLFTLFGTPSWAAQSGMQSIPGPYGSPGECAPVSNPAFITAFITALLTRYNTPATPTFIKGIEIWNEPMFDSPPVSNYYYWGTAEQMVATAIAVRAATSAFPGVKVHSPGFVSGSVVMRQFAEAASAGTTGAQAVDAFGIHPYHCTPYGGQSVIMDPNGNSLRSAGQFGKPVYVTEYGQSDDPNTAALASQPLAVRYATIARNLVMAAVRGCQGWYLYGYDNNLCGDLIGDTNGAIKAATDVHNHVAGKTITAAWLNADGSITTEHAGGQFTF